LCVRRAYPGEQGEEGTGYDACARIARGEGQATLDKYSQETFDLLKAGLKRCGKCAKIVDAKEVQRGGGKCRECQSYVTCRKCGIPRKEMYFIGPDCEYCQ